MLTVLPPSNLAVAIVIGILFLYYLRNRHFASSKSLPFPPGPPRGFLTGHTLNIPLKRPWLTYSDWAKEFGSLLGVRIAGEKDVVIIGSLQAARDLLEKNGQLYSDRPFSVMDDLGGWHFNLPQGAMPYSDSWRKHRRLYQQNFRPAAVQQFQPIQRRKVHDLVLNMIDSPQNFYEHVAWTTGAIIMSTVYGHDISQKDDPFIEVAEKASLMRGILLTPGKFPISHLPFARHFPSWVPGCGFKRIAQLSREYTKEAQARPFNFAMDQKLTGKGTSLVADLVEQLHDDDHDYAEKLECIRNMASTSYIAGASTTKSVILTFLLAMTLNPHIQAKAQEEIDRVIGMERLPDFSDRKDLPYVEAVYRETMRWQPPIPLGTPRRVMQTDFYNGYCIPEGTTIYPNLWAISRDETQYEEPHQFRPERYLQSGAGINDILLFGFGRRICAGRYLADASVWMAVATILATLHLEKAKDSEGNDVHIEWEYDYDRISPIKLKVLKSASPNHFIAPSLLEGRNTFTSLRRHREPAVE